MERNTDRRKIIMYVIGVFLAILGFVQFVHNFAMIQAYSSIAAISGLTDEFLQVYEKEILKAQGGMALGLLGFFIAIYAATSIPTSLTKEKPKEASGR